MVQKFGKFGVRSGNSLKGFNSRYMRCYGRDAVVFRETINCPNLIPSSDNIVGQTDVLTNDVPYSLNKKGRWSLPEEIKRSILSGELRREEFGVQLVELHKINKAANCVAVYASRGPVGKVAIQKRKSKKNRKRTGYMQAKSIINAKSHGTSKRRRRESKRRGLNTDEVEENEEPTDEPSQVRYEVIYPSPVTSSVTHNPKYIGFDTTKVRAKSGHKKRRRKHRLILMDEDMFDMEYQFDESEDEDCSHDNEQSPKSERQETFLIDDIVRHAERVRQHFNREENRRRKCYDEETKQTRQSKIVYEFVSANDESINQHNDVTAVVNSTMATRKSPTSEPVLVCLKIEDVDPLVLNQTYGDLYVESECFPRKFIVDISEMVSKTKLLKTSWKYCPDKINANVVFVFDVDNEINTLKEHVYKVYLNTSVQDDIKYMKIETLFDYMETSVEDCLTRSLFFTEILSDHLDITNTFTTYGKVIPTQTEELANWKASSYLPNNSFVYSDFLKCSQPMVDVTCQMSRTSTDSYTMDESSNVSSPDSRFCGVCYGTLGSSLQGTALMSCGHWFCDVCWKEYLETEVRNGAVSLLCPEFNCDAVVDKGTMMSILNMRDIIKFAKCCHDTKVEQQAATKWCPNEKCGRVLQVGSEKVEIVNCACGQKICFKCNGKKHWPASCEIVKAYNTKMKELGLEDDEPEAPVIHFVNGRSCPSCKRFVEKDGGCPFMFCVCKQSFCWGCGKPWGTVNHSKCSRGNRNVHKGTFKKPLKTFFNVTDEHKTSENAVKSLLDIAVDHRVEQHRKKVNEMKVSAKRIARGLQYFVTRSNTKGERILLDVDFPPAKASKEPANVNDFLNQMISLHSEINHIAEHSAVLLMDDSASERDTTRFLKHIINRFQCISTVIHETIVYGQDCHPKELIRRLKDAKFHALKGIKALIWRVKNIR